MSLIERIKQDCITALKAHEREKVTALRMTISDLQKAELDHSEPLTEAQEVAIIQRAVKQRREAAEAFEKGGRQESAQAELAELELLTTYLPQQLSDEELAEAVQNTIAETGASSMKDMGRVMGTLLKANAGRVDGNRVKPVVQAALAALG